MRIVLLAILFACAGPAAAQLVPGDWEFVSSTTSTVLPKPQTSTVRQCISQAQAEDPASFTTRSQPLDCTNKPGEKSGNTYTWTITCPKLGMTGTGRASFGGGTLHSEMRMTLVSDGKTMELHSVTKGRHLGPCSTK